MEYAPTTKQPKKLNNIVFLFLSILIIAGSFLAAISLVFPQVFSVLANMFWIALLVLVVVFLVLGFLVFFGMKKEVSKFLDILLEGSLTIIDAVEFIKKLYFYFIQLVKEFILFITPILAVGTAMAVYLGILVLYKYVGKENDVTLLTIILTAVLVAAVAFLTLPATEQDDIPGEIKETSWGAKVKMRFKLVFSDTFEVVVFIFFLTMDSTNIPFLPEGLRVPLHARFFDVDLMYRGANITHQLQATINLVTLGISIEVLRNIIKLSATGAAHYGKTYSPENSRAAAIKEALRHAVSTSKDDLIKFITFTTFLIIVFLLFPRLKLLAMVVASITALILDLAIPKRLTTTKGSDLVSRMLAKAFKL